MRCCEIGASRLHQLLVARGCAHRRRLAELHDAGVGGLALAFAKSIGMPLLRGPTNSQYSPTARVNRAAGEPSRSKLNACAPTVSTMTFLTWARSRSVFG